MVWFFLVFLYTAHPFLAYRTIAFVPSLMLSLHPSTSQYFLLYSLFPFCSNSQNIFFSECFSFYIMDELHPLNPLGILILYTLRVFIILYSLALRDYITSESPFQFVFFYHLCFMLETLLQCLEIFGLFIFNRMHWKSQFGRSLALWLTFSQRYRSIDLTILSEGQSIVSLSLTS